MQKKSVFDTTKCKRLVFNCTKCKKSVFDCTKCQKNQCLTARNAKDRYMTVPTAKDRVWLYQMQKIGVWLHQMQKIGVFDCTIFIYSFQYRSRVRVTRLYCFYFTPSKGDIYNLWIVFTSYGYKIGLHKFPLTALGGYPVILHSLLHGDHC